LTTILLASVPLTTAVASATPALQTNRGCYLVGQSVAITGSGFAPSRSYTVSLDGINLGVSKTGPTGGFSVKIKPGGLGANRAQNVEMLAASDGTITSRTTFTVTRRRGARIFNGSGTGVKIRAQFQAWGFDINGAGSPYSIGSTRLPVYVHYVGPHQHLRTTVALGNTGGQCGYLQTARRRVFPFTPAPGNWTLQLDTSRRYIKHPAGPVYKIPVRVS
jgi:hypothetical protein